MTECEYKKRHIKSQQEIVDYLREVKREKVNKMIERELCYGVIL